MHVLPMEKHELELEERELVQYIVMYYCMIVLVTHAWHHMINPYPAILPYVMP
jgi:streptomycin 6-kinase